MARSYERARWMRRVAGVLVPLVWIGGLWLLSEWVGRGLLKLEGVWAWVAGAACVAVGIPVGGFLLYLLAVLVIPLITGKKIDWR